MPYNSWLILKTEWFLKKGVIQLFEEDRFLHCCPEVGGNENFKLQEIVFRTSDDFRVARGLDNKGNIRHAIQWWNFPTIDFCPYWVFLPNSLQILSAGKGQNELIIMSLKGWDNDIFK